MTRSTLLYPLFLVLLIASCAAEDTDGTDEVTGTGLEESLLGTWETVELNVEYATYMGGDTAYVEEITEADWGKKYGVHPPSTLFTADGKLRRTHRLRSGQVANITNGIWKTQGDSLMVIEPNITYMYAPQMQGDRLELTGIVDQDQDGQRDDSFRAVYRLTGRTR